MPVTFVAREDLSDTIAKLERSGERIAQIIPDGKKFIIVSQPRPNVETR